MPDRPTTIAAYAAGASLAAITLFYVFGPTFFIDGEGNSSSSFLDSKKRTIVGLSNPANDCFINSVLQALAGLGDLRIYLIKEIHRRQLDGKDVYDQLDPKQVLRNGEKTEVILNLQRGLVTRALKEMLDALNERPIYRKTISARPMIEALEKSYSARVSRNQQDAQEFLQKILERLSEEYEAGEKARKRWEMATQEKDPGVDDEKVVEELGGPPSPVTMEGRNNTSAGVSTGGFPFEGRTESQIQCMYCGFKTKPSISTFYHLTLNVPQGNSTTLDKCFDILLKTEEIDDYRCDRCRLTHAIEQKQAQLRKTTLTSDMRQKYEQEIAALEKIKESDPEVEPKGIEMPDSATAPRRKIKKYTRITTFPKVIAIHLSRSVFDAQSYSSKNMSKVSYTERLRLGGLLNEHWYRLLGVVCHKGSHNSGHYESFRRNHIYPPFATPDVWGGYRDAKEAGSLVSTSHSTSPTDESTNTSDASSKSVTTEAASKNETRPSTATGTAGVASEGASTKPSFLSAANRTNTSQSKPQIHSHTNTVKKKASSKKQDRWWRVSDDKIKEAKTGDVLGMQREVYLLFYELERPEINGQG